MQEYESDYFDGSMLLELLDFDAEPTATDTTESDSIEGSTDSSSSRIYESATSQKGPRAVKALSRRSTKTRSVKGWDIVQMLENLSTQKAVRRRKPLPLQAFPTYDKCDSLLYFAHGISRHANSADYTAMYKLMRSHLHKSCGLALKHGAATKVVSCKSFVTMIELMGDLQPDRIMCVHSTEVVDNQIRSRILMKMTDVKAIYDQAAKTMRNPEIAYKIEKREEMLKHKIATTELSPGQMQEYMALVDNGADLEMNVRLDMTLTFDHVSKKVTALEMQHSMLSMRPVVAVR